MQWMTFEHEGCHPQTAAELGTVQLEVEGIEP